MIMKPVLFMDLLRLGILRSLSMIMGAFLYLEQFPLRGSGAADPCSCRDTVLTRNSLTEGFSFRPYLYLCFPDSRGSWQNRSLQTPGTLSKGEH